MKKRVISILFAVVLAFSLVTAAQAAGSGLDNFTPRNTYTSGQFGDVGAAAWYAMYIQADYEYGLLGGRSEGVFAPSEYVTAGEAVKLASCLHSIYHTGTAAFPADAPWYAPYADYALQNGIIDAPFGDYGAPVTRAVFAGMISRALPESAFPAINSIGDNAIPDVSMTDGFSGAVYRLYRAGILKGCDLFGTFNPFGNLSRAEAAAVAARAADTGFRTSLALPRALDGEELYMRCADAVFYLERYDSGGNLMGIGSGFFISRDGLAVTNYHVIDGAASAVITTSDGTVYAVKGVCGYDKKTDLAVLQIDGAGFPYLPLADPGPLDIGTFVYTIGSPLGLINTISAGIVSSPVRELDGSTYIQYTAPISMGSGGGPVLNSLGQVVGVSCLTVRSGQTLNFAVPADFIGGLSRTDCTPLAVLLLNADQLLSFYAGYYPVPDYGRFTETPLYKEQYDQPTDVKTFFYKQSDITADEDKAIYGYTTLLAGFGFEWQSSYINDYGYHIDVYYCEAYGISVHFGQDKLDGVECWFVAIHH